MRIHQIGTLVGSPPRAWGQWRIELGRRTPPRFTPTGVGTICRTGNAATAPPVHPHGRGDNCALCDTRTAGNGSPPRAWGQSRGAPGTRRRVRFTPTGVGTMFPTLGDGATRAVHPHGRGDNVDAARRLTIPVGSPPRAWGQSRRSAATPRPLRFTPTGVGTMARWSPPRRSGFTPTGVGTMRSAFGIRCHAAVHPHGRGDNCDARLSYCRVFGSPPRAWGQLHGHDPVQTAIRFTPTGVGTIRCYSRPSPP